MRARIGLVLAITMVLAGLDAPPVIAAEPGYIDTHAHVMRNAGRRGSPASQVSTILSAMDKTGVAMTILLPPPYPVGQTNFYGLTELRGIVTSNPKRFAFAAGGESLNAMVHRVKAGEVTATHIQALQQEATRIADAGAAGFGEIALEHFSSGRGNHPYESAQPDHPLLLALADVAAERSLPLDLHMEAIPADMDLPPRMAGNGGPNPPRLAANVPAFERLLAHNRKARIVWAHAGWDLSGERTVGLMRRLLGEHPNLYMSIKIDRGSDPRSVPFAGEDRIKGEWLELLRAFPDRFVIGSDQFYDEELGRLTRIERLMKLLPEDLAARIGAQNARAIYRLPPG